MGVPYILTNTQSASGDILAYASTDLSIGLVDAQQLKVSKTFFLFFETPFFSHSCKN